MAVEYFGRNTTAGVEDSGDVGYCFGNNPAVTAWTCPGTGNYTVQELTWYCKHSTGTAAQIRLGIYNAAGDTLIGEGTAAVTVDSTTAGWYGHTTQASVKAAGGSSPCTLVGGTSYLLGGAIDETNGANLHPWIFDGGANAARVINAQTGWMDGMKATWTSNLSVWLPNIRCGVIAAAVALAGSAGLSTWTLPTQALVNAELLAQTAIRWRIDDEDEDHATWAAAENAGLSAAAGTKRLRVQVNHTGDPAAITPKWQYRRKPSGGAWGDWTTVGS